MPRGSRASRSSCHASALAHTCPHEPDCFGCPLIQIPYPEQLHRKQTKLEDALADYPCLASQEVEPIVPSPKRLGYRARVKMVVGREHDHVVTGLYAPGTHHISDISSCPVHVRDLNTVLHYLKDSIAELQIVPYNQATDEGQLRYIDLRYSVYRQEVVVTLVTRHTDFPEGPGLARRLMKRFRFIRGVVQNINEDPGNVIWGKRLRTLAGRDSILERFSFLQLKFPAGVFSQANPRVARKLYARVLEAGKLEGDETVLDAYCGVGPISLYLASRARLVWGVDENPVSIATAKQNARMNGFGNCRFSAREIADVAREMHRTLGRVDLIAVNPPRKGIQPDAMDAMIALNATRWLYVSCEPTTLARDLAKLLDCGYRVDLMQPFDMFPQTEDLETLVSITAQEPEYGIPYPG